MQRRVYITATGRRVLSAVMWESCEARGARADEQRQFEDASRGGLLLSCPSEKYADEELVRHKGHC